MTAPAFLTTVELAERWGCAPKTIRNRIAAGGALPPVTRLAGPRFAIADVIAFENARREVA